MVSTKTVVASTAAVALAVSLGYLVWFDHQRTKDPKFRKQLKARARKVQEKKNLEENRDRIIRSETKSGNPSNAIDPSSPIPEDPEERSEYFMKLLQYGELLASRGPSNYPAAAAAFFKAIQAYNDPMSLLMVLQQSLPEEIMIIIMDLYAAELKSHQKKYFEHFPVPEMNVKVKEVVMSMTAEGKRIVRRGLVVTKDFEAGEIIFSEDPIISTQLENAVTTPACAYCLTLLTDEATAVCETCETESYCSVTCRDSAATEYHTVLCLRDAKTGAAATALKAHCDAEASIVPQLVARFLAKMVAEEKVKKEGKEKYSTWDHLERLYDLKPKVTDVERAEVDLIKNTIGPHVPGFADFLSEERYMVLKGKIQYNMYGVASSPTTTATPINSIQTVRGTASPVLGAGLYRTLGFLAHSCTPTAAVEFPSGTRTAAVRTLVDLKTGDEVFVQWTSVDRDASATSRRKILREKVAAVECCLAFYAAVRGI
ncbi:hypothetical protein HKX48_002086 [Thoreauomyces humboldtii]|nr:hypothetical protein HKX48_002086 [Thoreauomyces humboldtii]